MEYPVSVFHFFFVFVPKKSRPADPKNNRESFRLSDDDMKKLKFFMERTSMSKTDIVRKGINLVYQETANQ